MLISVIFSLLGLLILLSTLYDIIILTKKQSPSTESKVEFKLTETAGIESDDKSGLLNKKEEEEEEEVEEEGDKDQITEEVQIEIKGNKRNEGIIVLQYIYQFQIKTLTFKCRRTQLSYGPLSCLFNGKKFA